MAQTQHLPALLGSVGLGHLAPRLTQNEIDWETARLMKSSDLADVGMTYYSLHDSRALSAEEEEREEGEEVVARGGGD